MDLTALRTYLATHMGEVVDQTKRVAHIPGHHRVKLLILTLHRGAMPFNVLRFPLINLGEFGPRVAIGSQQLIELGLYSLGVTMPGPLNKKGHRPSSESSDCMPIKSLTVEDQPEAEIDEPHSERPWRGHKFTDVR